MCFSFYMLSSVSCHIQGQTGFVSPFSRFSVFMPYFMSYNVNFSFSTFFSSLAIIQVYCVYFSFFMFFSVSSRIPGRTVFVSHFARFSVFFAIFQALPCEFLIFLLCQFLLDIFQVSQCLCSIFHVFQWFLPYSRSYHVSFSFSSFEIFLAIFQVLM